MPNRSISDSSAFARDLVHRLFMISRDGRVSTPKFLSKFTRAAAREFANAAPTNVCPARRVLCTDRLSAAQLVTTKRRIVSDNMAELSRNANKASRLIFIFSFFASSFFTPTISRSHVRRHFPLYRLVVPLFLILYIQNALNFFRVYSHDIRYFCKKKKVEIAIRCCHFYLDSLSHSLSHIILLLSHFSVAEVFQSRFLNALFF